jgi:hypothetical protein
MSFDKYDKIFYEYLTAKQQWWFAEKYFLKLSADMEVADQERKVRWHELERLAKEIPDELHKRVCELEFGPKEHEGSEDGGLYPVTEESYVDELKELREWLRQSHTATIRSRGNRWFKIGPMEIYLRKYNRKIDVANVTVNEKYRGCGYYTTFLDWLYRVAFEYGYKEIKHENVHELRLQKFHERRGLTRITLNTGGLDLTPSYVKKIAGGFDEETKE